MAPRNNNGSLGVRLSTFAILDYVKSNNNSGFTQANVRKWSQSVNKPVDVNLYKIRRHLNRSGISFFTDSAKLHYVDQQTAERLNVQSPPNGIELTHPCGEPLDVKVSEFWSDYHAHQSIRPVRSCRKSIEIVKASPKKAQLKTKQQTRSESPNPPHISPRNKRKDHPITEPVQQKRNVRPRIVVKFNADTVDTNGDSSVRTVTRSITTDLVLYRPYYQLILKSFVDPNVFQNVRNKNRVQKLPAIMRNKDGLVYLIGRFIYDWDLVVTWSDFDRQYRQGLKKFHSDKGGDDLTFVDYVNAFKFIRQPTDENRCLQRFNVLVGLSYEIGNLKEDDIVNRLYILLRT